MKLFKYAFLVNFSLLCIPYQSFSVDTNQPNILVIEQHADAGDLKALFSLGVMYYKGQGVTKNYSKAIEYFTKAADQGDVQSQLNLGIIYRNGEVVPMNYSKAMKYFKKAADQGSEAAKMNIEAGEAAKMIRPDLFIKELNN